MEPKPKVLLIGDSIAMGYAPRVAGLLADRAIVNRCEGAGDSGYVLANLEHWLLAVPAPDIIHFNAGLHDLRRSRQTRAHQVQPEGYVRNLVLICRRLRQTRAGLIWATITPVLESRHNTPEKGFDRRNRDVDAYNSSARSIMQDFQVAIDDLHAAALAGDLEKILSGDGVHFTDDGCRLLANQVADCIGRFLM